MDIDHQEILDSVETGESGATLAELQRVAKAHGLQTSVLHATPEALPELAPPFIAHMLPTHGNTTEHFVVVVQQDAGFVTVIDGDDGRLLRMARPRFESRWSGYLLMRKPSVPAWFWLGAGLLVLPIAFLCWRRQPVRLEAMS
ncbi:MAG: hypothetical protein K2W96_11725 [Gemmataceae bacterium]|nr:hypothetical protein [Gemmataceae bacterium]